MRIRRYIPNAITVSRVMLSLILLLVTPFGYAFLGIYILCGVTDIADGYLARKWSLASGTGAILDSIADVVFLGVTLLSIARSITVSSSIIAWIILIAGVRCLSITIGMIRYRKLIMLHTYANKATGVIIFSYAFLYQCMDSTLLAYFVCLAASISAVEELLINCTSKEVDRDRKGILIRKGR